MKSPIRNLFISVVIPVYNESGNIKILFGEIVASLEKITKNYEIIFINDGSTDSTLSELIKLKPATIINFRKNSGQTAAFDAGIKHASGNVIVTMDGDLQNDPRDINKLLLKINEGYDVVSGWRKNRKDPFSKRLISRTANLLRKIFVRDKIHDSGCSLKAYRKECFDTIDLTGEMHRFIPAILQWKGFDITEVVVNHRPRKSGKTKYNWSRAIKGFIDMMFLWFWRKFSSRPLHLLGGFGLLLVLASIVSGSMAIWLKLVHNVDLSDTALTMLSISSLLAGIQLLVSGLLIDILSKTYFASTKDKTYLIKEIIRSK